MAKIEGPVLIAGGGVVGLSSALFLANHGVPSLLVEKHPNTCIHPRARGVSGRTMELFREIGLEEDIRRAGAELAKSTGFLVGKTLHSVLSGHEGQIFRIPPPSAGSAGSPFEMNDASPTSGARCPQDKLEPLLVEAARTRGADLRFGTELTHFEQDDAGVTATLRERASGDVHTVRAPYMIAADGAKSPIRQKLGVTMRGRGEISHQLNIYFQADLSDLVRGREFSICIIEQPEVIGILTSINNTDLWVFHAVYFPHEGQSPEDFPPERCAALIRTALGMPEVDVAIRSVLPWAATVAVADRFQHGRIFLAGDAAHVMPPWGGMGASTGIQDAHNLAWKLAAVRNGTATPSLLSTYDVERHPVATLAAEQSGALGGPKGILSPSQWADSFKDRFTPVGFRYRSRGIFTEERDAVEPVECRDLDGRPGTRAPHAWLERDGRRVSTLDLFGRSFVLLAGPDGAEFCDAARTFAARSRIPLAAYRVGPHGDLLDDGHWAAAAGIHPKGAILVRPDGFVAWRTRESVEAPASLLGQVLDGLLT